MPDGGTEFTVQQLKEKFGDPPDVVTLTGLTEVVDGVRRVYLTPECDAWVEFTAADSAEHPHHIQQSGEAFDKIWVGRNQPLTLRVLNSEFHAGYLEGPIADFRLSVDVLAVDLFKLLRQLTRAICLSKTKYTGPRCQGLPSWPRPGDWLAGPDNHSL